MQRPLLEESFEMQLSFVGLEVFLGRGLQELRYFRDPVIAGRGVVDERGHVQYPLLGCLTGLVCEQFRHFHFSIFAGTLGPGSLGRGNLGLLLLLLRLFLFGRQFLGHLGRKLAGHPLLVVGGRGVDVLVVAGGVDLYGQDFRLGQAVLLDQLQRRLVKPLLAVWALP